MNVTIKNETIFHQNCCHVDIAKFHEAFRTNNQAGDAIWILTSAFIIFTMQSGFGLLEAGSVSSKNECNIMIKNAIDVIFGTFGYWLCGFGFSFGNSEYANGFSGFGNFLTDETSDNYGTLYAKYFFQLSFATTATTIVSGAMAERTNLKAYMFFSFINFTSYVFPAHWIWDEKGFLSQHIIDVAGCGPVHLVGGVSGLVATIMLKPRIGFLEGKKQGHTSSMASPTNVVLGTFMLWWGWLGFNCGSTFGVSDGKWQLASRAAVTTLNSSVGSSLWCIFYCYFLTKDFDGKLDVPTFTNGILAGLVSNTAACAICRPWEAIIIGIIGGIICCYGSKLIRYLNIDDPVQVISVHGLCSIWGLLAVGLFAEKTNYKGRITPYGVLKGGPWSLLGWQALTVVVIILWAAATSFIQLYATDKIFTLRISAEEEINGADFSEHNITSETYSRGQINISNSIHNISHENAQNGSSSSSSSSNTTSDEKSGVSFAIESSKDSSFEMHSVRRYRKYSKNGSQYRRGILNYGFLSINNTERSSHSDNMFSNTDYELGHKELKKRHLSIQQTVLNNNVKLSRSPSLPNMQLK